MNGRFVEPLLNQPITELDFSQEFKGVTELLGFFTLADLLEHHTAHLEKMPGFSQHLIYEFVDFLESRRMGHYIDP